MACAKFIVLILIFEFSISDYENEDGEEDHFGCGSDLLRKTGVKLVTRNSEAKTAPAEFASQSNWICDQRLAMSRRLRFQIDFRPEHGTGGKA